MQVNLQPTLLIADCVLTPELLTSIHNMFEDDEIGLAARVIARWRRFRGQDKWPVVPATVVGREIVSGPDGDLYKLVLKYRMPGTPDNEFSIAVAQLFTAEHSYAEPGDRIALMVHPTREGKAIFADTFDSERSLKILTGFALFAILLVAYRLSDLN